MELSATGGPEEVFPLAELCQQASVMRPHSSTGGTCFNPDANPVAKLEMRIFGQDECKVI